MGRWKKGRYTIQPAAVKGPCGLCRLFLITRHAVLFLKYNDEVFCFIGNDAECRSVVGAGFCDTDTGRYRCAIARTRKKEDSAKAGCKEGFNIGTTQPFQESIGAFD